MKINISKTDILLTALCTACAWLGGAAVGLINEKLAPSYARGYEQGKEDARKELKTRFKEEEENETEDEEEDGS